MNVGVVIFPGSNCDQDMLHAFERVLGQPTRPVWHKETDITGLDLLVLPGGFSYGDYLRCGAIAAQSPVMRAVKQFAEAGGRVLGVCNGFQILTEAGLLPGVLLRNEKLKFACKTVHVRVENINSPFTSHLKQGEVLALPIAHAEGNYFLDAEGLAQLEAAGQVAFRYCTPEGELDPSANPNGACHHIAGILNARGNVLGMMPHPERAMEAVLGSTDGLKLLSALTGEG